MSATRQEKGQFDQIGLPWDLSLWIDKKVLLAWIEADIATFEWNNDALVSFLQSHPEFRPRALLTLLTYCYVTAIYGSEEIFESCYQEQTCRNICDGEAPTARAIAGFRRENRGLLKWLLVQLFKRALKMKLELNDVLVPPGLKRRLEEAASMRIDIARHVDRGAREC